MLSSTATPASSSQTTTSCSTERSSEFAQSSSSVKKVITGKTHKTAKSSTQVCDVTVTHLTSVKQNLVLLSAIFGVSSAIKPTTHWNRCPHCDFVSNSRRSRPSPTSLCRAGVAWLSDAQQSLLLQRVVCRREDHRVLMVSSAKKRIWYLKDSTFYKQPTKEIQRTKLTTTGATGMPSYCTQQVNVKPGISVGSILCSASIASWSETKKSSTRSNSLRWWRWLDRNWSMTQTLGCYG